VLSPLLFGHFGRFPKGRLIRRGPFYPVLLMGGNVIVVLTTEFMQLGCICKAYPICKCCLHSNSIRVKYYDPDKTRLISTN
jgi:hypothetical protein